MEIHGEYLNANLPVFVVFDVEGGPTARAWGAVWARDRWLVPAYFPFGVDAARDLQTVHPRARWAPSAQELLRSLNETSQAWDQVEAARASGEDPLRFVHTPEGGLPADFFPPNFQPFAHQRYGMARVQMWYRSWFLWEMRTGKTRTMLDGLRLLDLEGKFGKALIIAPPVVLPSWVAETRRVTRGAWDAVIWDNTPETRERARTAKLVLASYARIRLEAVVELPHAQQGTVRIFAPEQSPLLGLGYDVIIADESHRLGNWDSEQTRAAIELSRPATRRYCLTGTAGDHPLKVYGQLRFLAPGLCPLTWDKFEAKHVVHSPRSKHVVTGFSALNEINAMVDSVAHRIKQKECLDLPPRTVIDAPFNLGPLQRARYNELVTELSASVDPVLAHIGVKRDGEVVPLDVPPAELFRLPHGAALVQKLRQLISGFILLGTDDSICNACPQMEQCVETGVKPYTRKCVVVQTKPPRKVLRDTENPKLDLFEGLISSILEEDPTNKIICWGEFTSELDDMEACARKLGAKPVRLDGSTTKNVAAISAAMQEDPTCRVLVGMATSGIGIDLSAANFTIFYSRSWDPLVNDQATERFGGPGQKRPTTVYHLTTSAETPALDRFIASTLQFKGRVAYTMLERVTCAACDRQQACALDGTFPFRENCRYAAAVARPVTKVKTL